MATLEDKILGERTGDNYCSSSEDEAEASQPKFIPDGPDSAASGPPVGPPMTSARYNTGPKGVLEDWRRYKQLQSEEKGRESAELHQLAEKLSKTCRTYADDQRAAVIEKQQKEVKESLADEDDPFVKEYMQKRLAEMQAALVAKQRGHAGVSFGELCPLKSADEYLNAADSDSLKATVIVHIYEPGVPGCSAMNESLAELAQQYITYKFCTVLASLLGTSGFFKRSGVPTLQAYRDGQLIGNFVRGDLETQMSDEFPADEVASLLIEYGILPDAQENARILKSKA